MHTLLRYRNCKDYLRWQIAVSGVLRCLLLLAVSSFGLSTHQQILAQSKPGGTGASSLCTHDNAVDLIGQQIDLTRTFDHPVRRIIVLIRAADLLWPLQQSQARAAFSEAFDVASQNEKEKSERSKDRQRSLVMEMQAPDQRYVVIRAIAKRDSAWAKKLTQQLLKRERESGNQAPTKDSFNDLLTAQKLLDSARQLIAVDVNAAVDLAKMSLNLPAGVELSRFLYALAEVSQAAADQFYDQALVVYADRPMREFLYLQAYPFAFRESGDMPVFGFYQVPANFVVNNSLQLRFVQTLLRRAQQALEVPLDEADNFQNANGNSMPGTSYILQALMRIEPQISKFPDLLDAVVLSREKILVSLPAEIQTTFLRPELNAISSAPEKTLDERIETAKKMANANQRDDMIVEAILSLADKGTLDGLMRASDSISDSNLRGALIEWIYFSRTKEAANGKRFDEAERLAAKVEGREQRAYLLTEIAKGLLNTSETQIHGREVLDEAITEANKAGMTIFAARTLLSASNLYAKIDLSRSLSVLGDAINCINHIEAPDFSRGDQTLAKRIKRRSNPGQFLIRFYMPGLDPENAFREMAKIDFDDALSQTSAFTDKFQRAVTSLALAEVCLQQAKRQPKENPKRIAKPVAGS